MQDTEYRRSEKPSQARPRSRANSTLRRTAIALSTLAISAMIAPHANAQSTLTWDANTTLTGAQDGSGTWDATTTADWYNGTTDQTWGNPTSPANLALFGVGGTSGTVTLSGTLNVAGISFSQSGYALANGTSGILALTSNSGGAVVLSTATGTTTTIADAIGLSSAAGVQIQKTGAGTLSLSTGNTGSNVNTATWTVTGGTFNSTTGLFTSVLAVGSAARLGSAPNSATTAQVILDSGTLQVGTSAFSGSSELGAARLVQVNAAGGAIADATTGVGNNSIDGPITNNAGAGSSLYLSNISGIVTRITGGTSGTGSVTWNGAGTATVSGTNTYTGATIIKGGIYNLTGSLAAGSAVSVNGGTLTGTGRANGAVTIAAAATINPGAIGTIGTLITGADTFATGSTLIFDYGGNAVDSLTSTGLVTGLSGANFVFNSIGGAALTNASYTLVGAGSFFNNTLPTSITGLPAGYILQYSGNNLNLIQGSASAPEPMPLALLGLGIIGQTGRLLRRRTRS